MQELHLIAVINKTLATDPLFEHLPSPVTVEHTDTHCSVCDAECWIGPRQKEFAESGQGQIICYMCIATNPTYAAVDTATIALNPTADRLPRKKL
jgi:hypothetical protein